MKNYIPYTIIALLLIIYIYFAILGLNGYGIIKVQTEKTEYNVGENVIVYTQNIGLTPLGGYPNWCVYKINDKNETSVARETLKCCQIVLPFGYIGIGKEKDDYAKIGVKHNAWVWNPQSPGVYKIVVFLSEPPSYELTEHIPSDYIIITVKYQRANSNVLNPITL